jgi:hypothetical protein
MYGQGLERLDLSRTNFSDADAGSLVPLAGLRELLLDDQPICSAGPGTLEVLARLPRLSRLSLRGNCELTARSLTLVLAPAPRLSVLDVRGATKIDIELLILSLPVFAPLTSSS